MANFRGGRGVLSVLIILMFGCGETISQKLPYRPFNPRPSVVEKTDDKADTQTNKKEDPKVEQPSPEEKKENEEENEEEPGEETETNTEEDPATFLERAEGLDDPQNHFEVILPPYQRDNERTPPLRNENSPPPIEETPPPAECSGFADRVVSFQRGNGAGLNENNTDVVLGPPHGAGCCSGNTNDILSLGLGGTIILEFTDCFIFDRDGVDFTVFENAFEIALANPPITFAEPAVVAVSEDGINFQEFPCNPRQRPYEGCAGVQPVLANPDTNNIDPADPFVSGGDSFDLHDVGLRSVRFVRIRDSGIRFGPIGPGNTGFDLDAVGVIHGIRP